MVTGPNLWEDGAQRRDDEAAWSVALRGLEAACDRGAELGVAIGFEPCWGTFAHDAEDGGAGPRQRPGIGHLRPQPFRAQRRRHPGARPPLGRSDRPRAPQGRVRAPRYGRRGLASSACSARDVCRGRTSSTRVDEFRLRRRDVGGVRGLPLLRARSSVGDPGPGCPSSPARQVESLLADREREAPMRTGIVGLGEIGQHHLRTIRGAAGRRRSPRSATSIPPSRTRAPAARSPAYTELAAMLADAGSRRDRRLPSPLAPRRGGGCGRSMPGCDVLLEKPLAVDLDGLRPDRRCRRPRRSVEVGVSHNQLFYRPHERLRELIDRGRLGEIAGDLRPALDRRPLSRLA